MPSWNYCTPLSNDAVDEILEGGIVSFDTNVLLNLYAYSDPTTEMWFQAIDRHKENLWLTCQAMNEFIRNRCGAILKQRNLIREAEKKLEDLLALFAQKNAQPFVPPAVQPDVKSMADALKTSFANERERFKNLLTEDPTLERLIGLFADNVGLGFGEERRQEIFKEGKNRFEYQIPPGYEDRGKERGMDKFGDLVLWFELIEYAKDRASGLILVTAEKKSDWWVRDDRGPVVGRPELAVEFGAKTSQRFHLMSPEDFLHASNRTGATVSKEAIAETAEIASLPQLSSPLTFGFTPDMNLLKNPVSEFWDQQKKLSEALSVTHQLGAMAKAMKLPKQFETRKDPDEQ